MGRMYSTALSLFSPLLAWYDRNASQAGIYWNSVNVAPHGSTVRATYTVPSGKKAFVCAAELDVRRRTAATTLGTVLAWLTFAGNMALQILHENNTVDNRQTITCYLGGILLSGQSLQLSTWDASTGGAMDYMLTALIVEFSA